MADEGGIPDIAKLLGDSDDDDDHVPRVRHDFDAAALVAGLGDFGQQLGGGGPPPRHGGDAGSAPSGSMGGQLQAGAFSDGDSFAPMAPATVATAHPPPAAAPVRHDVQPSPAKVPPTSSSSSSMATPASTAGRVWMERLPASMTEGELLGHLHTAGDPLNVFIFTTTKRVPAKCRTSVNAVVDFANAEEANNFVRAYDGVRAGEHRLRCTTMRPEYWWRPDVARTRLTQHFGQDQPGRTLSEHFDDSHHTQHVRYDPLGEESVVPLRSGFGGDSPGPAAAQPSANPLPVAPNVVAALLRAAGDAANYITTENTADYLTAKSALMAIAQHAARRRERLPPALQTAALLNGTDPCFVCDLLLAALHIVHGELEEGIRYAQALLQALPSSLDVLAYLGSYDGTLESILAPRGFSPLLLNHLVALGMMLEQVSVVAARAVLHTAQHRAVVHGVPACAELDTVLSTVPVPLSHPSVNKSSSLLHALGKEGSSFAAQLLQQLAFTSNPEPFAAPCVCIFDSASAVNPGLGPVW